MATVIQKRLPPIQARLETPLRGGKFSMAELDLLNKYDRFRIAEKVGDNDPMKRVNSQVKSPKFI